jgi:hypothetical protein
MKWGTIIYHTAERDSMATVGVRKAIKYGFVLLGYFLAVFIGGGIIAFVGFLIFVAGSDVGGAGGLLLVLIGGLLLLVGTLITFAGYLGVGYKVIADGVKRGVENSSGFGGSGGQDQNALERRDRGSSSRSGESSSSRSDRDSSDRSGESSSDRGPSDRSDRSSSS